MRRPCLGRARSRMDEEMESNLLTPEQAAQFLQCSEKRVHALCRQRKLAFVRLDGRGTRRFTAEQLRAFIAAQSVQATATVDSRDSTSVSCPKEGGGRRTKKSSGVEGKGPLTQEIRSLCQS
jgi:excisionase family DNA binding protein